MEHFEKSIIPVIESVYPSFTPLERTVADFFIHNTDESDLSARHVSELLYVSEASLSRFAKKMRLHGLPRICLPLPGRPERRTAWHGRSHQTGAEYVSGAAE